MHNKNIAYRISLYIHFHPDEVLDIKTLAEKYGISKYMLERLFRNVFGQTVHQYIVMVRLDKAYRLLTETDLPIKQIVSMVGYRSVPTFARHFKARYHKTPGNVRGNCQL